VLVIEDSPEMNRFICEILAAEYRIEKAFDGEEGLRKVMAARPDVILTDIMMPGLSGDQVIRHIRANPEFSRIPIIVLTAKADDEMRIQLLREGAQDYLTKPFLPEELRVRVNNLAALKHSQDELLETIAAAERVNTELEAFSYSVSHDLRAPLRALQGFSYILQDTYVDRIDEQGRDYLERIQRATFRMSELIDGLLQLSRITRAELVNARVDLSWLAHNAVADLANNESHRHVEVIIEENLAAQGDVRLLQLVFQNLIGNAWKFTRDATAPRIEFGAAMQGQEKFFFIRDNGAGFDSRYADKLFMPFQRLHSETDFPGTGIGLATVSRIVARHGGRIWAESEPNVMTTFWFAL